MECLVAMNAKINETSWIWYGILGYVSLDWIARLIRKDLIKCLPKNDFENNNICNVCQLGKQIRSLFKSKIIISTIRPLKLLHMNLFRPIKSTSLDGKIFGFIIIDYFYWFT